MTEKQADMIINRLDLLIKMLAPVGSRFYEDDNGRLHRWAPVQNNVTVEKGQGASKLTTMLAQARNEGTA